jgi:hypothetical protein
MKAPTFARIYGIVFLFVGAFGFAPLVTSPAPLSAEYLQLGDGYGFIFGLFPVNGLHDFVHIIFGGWGVIASFDFKWSVTYLRAVLWIYLVLVVLGLIPITNTLFGAMPVYGHDIWLHLLLALAAAYGAYGAGSNQTSIADARPPAL